MGMLNCKRGDLSGPIYTILMITFVIAASILIYNYFLSRANILTTQAQIEITNIQLTGNAYAVTVSNIGTVDVKLTSIKIYPEGSTDAIVSESLNAELKPGKSITITDVTSKIFTTGQRYVVIIQGVTSDGIDVGTTRVGIAQ